MSNSIQCPACKEGIDSDSLYCDQCGTQILVCSVCGRPGKGKRCMFDGKELVVPGGASASSAAGQVSQPPAAPAAAQVSSPAAAQASSPAASVPQAASGDKIRLASQSRGIVIDASANDVLGRKKGNFTSLLEKYNVISGNHCQILKLNGMWSIMDLGSTNGTFFNGQRLNPNSPMPLQNNGTVKLADIEFKVTFEQADDSGTSRI